MISTGFPYDFCGRDVTDLMSRLVSSRYSHTPLNRRTAVAVIAVAAVSSCSSAPAPDTVPRRVVASIEANRPHNARLEAAVRSYVRDYYGGHGRRAYRLLSKRCRRTDRPSQYLRHEQLVARQAGPQPAPRISITYLHAGHALLAYQLPDSRLSGFHTRWIYERGWRDDHC
jgi:hypothetical protein